MDTLEERVSRLEAIEAIRQIAARHALAVDSRDIATLTALYVDDVVAPDGRIGREALAAVLEADLRAYGTTFHLVGAHVIDVSDDDHASGTVQCRAEYEVDGLWIISALQHADVYERREGTWYLRGRETHAYYAADATEHPLRVPGRFHFPGRPPVRSAELPERFATWQRFWGQGPGIGQPRRGGGHS